MFSFFNKCANPALFHMILIFYHVYNNCNVLWIYKCGEKFGVFVLMWTARSVDDFDNMHHCTLEIFLATWWKAWIVKGKFYLIVSEAVGGRQNSVPAY
jgi:hypothetical protein